MACRARCSATTRDASRQPFDAIEVVVALQAAGRRRAGDAARATRAALAAGGFDIAGEQPAGLLDGSREHFGFTDGFSQPAIAGFARERRPGQGVPYRRRPFGRLRWRPLAAGEFVLGVPDEDGDPPPAPPAPFDRETTFMVLRKLRQDVAAFRAQAAQEAARLGIDVDDVQGAARRALARRQPARAAPRRPRPRPGQRPRGRQRLRLRRRPRRPALPARRPRAPDQPARRARVGGAPDRAPPHPAPRDALRPGAGEGRRDDEDRGLIFVSVQASIARQFEIVQQQWCNDGNAFGPRPRARPDRRPGGPCAGPRAGGDVAAAHHRAAAQLRRVPRRRVPRGAVAARAAGAAPGSGTPAPLNTVPRGVTPRGHDQS